MNRELLLATGINKTFMLKGSFSLITSCCREQNYGSVSGFLLCLWVSCMKRLSICPYS